MEAVFLFDFRREGQESFTMDIIYVRMYKLIIAL